MKQSCFQSLGSNNFVGQLLLGHCPTKRRCVKKNIIYLTVIASIILWLAILLLSSVGIVSGLVIVLCFGIALFILFKILYYRSQV